MIQRVSITIEDTTLEACRQYAEAHGMSLDEAIQHVLESSVSPRRKEWLDECFQLMDQAGADSQGRHWNREELYDG
jgi:hypothetical protein